MATITEMFADLPPGLYDYVLPFLIVFGIVYALLDKIELFGENNDAVSALLSIAFALYVTVNTQFGSVMASLIPSYGLILVFFIVIAMAFALFTNDDDWLGYIKYIGAVAALAVVLLVLDIGGYEAVYGADGISFTIPILGEMGLATLLILGAAAGAVYFVVQD